MTRKNVAKQMELINVSQALTNCRGDKVTCPLGGYCDNVDAATSHKLTNIMQIKMADRALCR